MDKKDFDKPALDEKLETFVVYIVVLKALLIKITIYLSQKALITALK